MPNLRKRLLQNLADSLKLLSLPIEGIEKEITELSNFLQTSKTIKLFEEAEISLNNGVEIIGYALSLRNLLENHWRKTPSSFPLNFLADNKALFELTATLNLICEREGSCLWQLFINYAQDISSPNNNDNNRLRFTSNSITTEQLKKAIELLQKEGMPSWSTILFFELMPKYEVNNAFHEAANPQQEFIATITVIKDPVAKEKFIELLSGEWRSFLNSIIRKPKDFEKICELMGKDSSLKLIRLLSWDHIKKILEQLAPSAAQNPDMSKFFEALIQKCGGLDNKNRVENFRQLLSCIPEEFLYTFLVQFAKDYVNSLLLMPIEPALKPKDSKDEDEKSLLNSHPESEILPKILWFLPPQDRENFISSLDKSSLGFAIQNSNELERLITLLVGHFSAYPSQLELPKNFIVHLVKKAQNVKQLIAILGFLNRANQKLFIKNLVADKKILLKLIKNPHDITEILKDTSYGNFDIGEELRRTLLDALIASPPPFFTGLWNSLIRWRTVAYILLTLAFLTLSPFLGIGIVASLGLAISISAITPMLIAKVSLVLLLSPLIFRAVGEFLQGFGKWVCELFLAGFFFSPTALITLGEKNGSTVLKGAGYVLAFLLNPFGYIVKYLGKGCDLLGKFITQFHWEGIEKPEIMDNADWNELCKKPDPQQQKDVDVDGEENEHDNDPKETEISEETRPLLCSNAIATGDYPVFFFEQRRDFAVFKKRSMDNASLAITKLEGESPYATIFTKSPSQ